MEHHVGNSGIHHVVYHEPVDVWISVRANKLNSIQFNQPQ
jgi:hypothetical protein